MANNPLHMAGAIDSDGADKAARFMRLCDAHGLPILTLIDTPGIMVGPEAEETGLVRHAARLFLAGAKLGVPVFAVILRKAYGLGAMAAAGGHFRRPVFTIAWPTGEIGGMGLEGAVRLGYRRELEAIADPAERKAWFEAKVGALYDKGKALSAASYFELDAVIDPAETRRWVVRGLDAAPPKPSRGGFIDAW
jgi:acetyl-CoA carboxylase carboxyltransferase component